MTDEIRPQWPEKKLRTRQDLRHTHIIRDIDNHLGANDQPIKLRQGGWRMELLSVEIGLEARFTSVET
jgi:hypothetical protein